MRGRTRRLIGLITGLLVAAATLAIPQAPAEAALATAVYRTDGVNGRFTGVTTNGVPAHVWDIEIIGNTAYVAGKFQRVVQSSGSWPEVAQPHLAAFDATSGEWIDWWRPQIDAPVWALDQTADGSLLVGGEFDTVNGEARGNLVALDPRTGQIDDRFYAEVDRPGTAAQSVIRDLYRAGDDVYIIGNFNYVRSGPGALRARYFKAARLDATSGTADPVWKPVIAGRSGWGIAESADGRRVHLGGEFSYVNRTPDSALLATVDSRTGASVPGWNGGSNAPFFTVWPLGGIVYDLDVYGNNLFVGGAEHYWEMRNSRTGASLKYQKVTNDTQNVEVIGGSVYIGCHCDGRNHWSPGKQVWQVNARTGAVQPDITTALQSGDGGWAAARAPDGCVWIGGDFRGTTELVGRGPGQYWVGRFARLCDAAGPRPHNVPSLSPPGAQNPPDVVEPEPDLPVPEPDLPPPDPPPPAPDPAELVAEDARWRYLDDGSDQGGDWTAPGFDDGSWADGPAPLGYGDGDEATVIDEGRAGGGPRAVTSYFRHTFTVDGPFAFSELVLGLLRDDGAVVHLNGVELVRDNLPTGPVGFDTLADGYASGTGESTHHQFVVAADLLRSGVNVLAVEVHSADRGSRDISFGLSLRAAGDGPQPPPAPMAPTTGSTGG